MLTKMNAEPASPGRPRDDSKASRQDNKTYNRCQQPHAAGPVLIQHLAGWT